MPAVADFLSKVITTPEGYFNLCLRSASGVWHSEFYEYPSQISLIEQVATDRAAEYDVYFTAYLFDQRDAHKDHVLPSRTIQQDLDGADISTLPLIPSSLIQTSPHRHQGFWITNDVLDIELHELLSKRLAYAIPDCDRSGWSLGHKVRLPYTYNHKYLDGPHLVTLISSNARSYSTEELELLPDVDSITLARFDESFINEPPSSNELGPFELVESIKEQLSAEVYAQFQSTYPAQDRSVALWALMLGLFRAGLTRDQVYWVAQHSPNNKFDRLKYHADRELAKDVLRAEHHVKSMALDIRAFITACRKQSKITLSERRRLITEAVMGDMRSLGIFLKCGEGRRYYIPHESGRPIYVGRGSEYLNAFLDAKYGLNKVESEHDYVVESMITHMLTLPDAGTVATLSHYVPHEHATLIHSGKKSVYQITKSAITTVTDGAHDIVFPWGSIVQPFTANLNTTTDWGHELFGDIKNVINMTPEEVEVVLKTWLMFVILRSASKTRPILALFGAPGCLSKSQQVTVKIADEQTLTRKVLTMEGLYREYTAGYKIQIQSHTGQGLQWKLIAKVVYSGIKPLFRVITADYNVLTCTKDHRILTDSGLYKPLSELKRGDKILIRHPHSKTYVKASSITDIVSVPEDRTYDIQMADQHYPSFLADNVVVHNSGKTTLACKIYAFLYGPGVEPSGLTTPDSFDMSTTIMPVLVLDNLDTWERWLPDRIAQAARATDVVVRRLYSDVDTVRLRRQSVLVLTAHDPKFGRADVTSRLLILSLQELTKRIDETQLLNAVLQARNRLWGSLIQDVQKVLANPIPTSTDLQLRIQDFALMGDWITKGLGCNDLFRDAVIKLKGSQFVFNLDSDSGLVQALEEWLHRTNHPEPTLKTEDELFNELATLALDQKGFFARFKNASTFGKRLSNLQSSLNTIMYLQQSIGKTGKRVWLIGPHQNTEKQDVET